jgi:hypothetical protein
LNELPPWLASSERVLEYLDERTVAREEYSREWKLARMDELKAQQRFPRTRYSTDQNEGPNAALRSVLYNGFDERERLRNARGLRVADPR